MKTRIISAAIGIAIFTVILFFFESLLFNAAVGVVSMVAVYELLHSTKYIKSKLLLVFCAIFTAIIPFLSTEWLNDLTILVVGTFTFILLIFMLLKICKFEQVSIMFSVSLLVTYAVSCLIFIRDIFTEDMIVGLFYVMFVFLCSWISDSGAYFTGRAFGKHKLAPEISPKKTVEGAIGGVIFCIVFGIAFTFIFFEVVAMTTDGFTYSVNIISLVIICLVASILSIFGDLTASMVKRQCAIKDFGHIMPGHGGVIDRFDSVLFVAPFIYSVLKLGVEIINYV